MKLFKKLADLFAPDWTTFERFLVELPPRVAPLNASVNGRSRQGFVAIQESFYGTRQRAHFSDTSKLKPITVERAWELQFHPVLFAGDPLLTDFPEDREVPEKIETKVGTIRQDLVMAS